MTSIKMQAPFFFFLLGLLIREAFKKGIFLKKKVIDGTCILGKVWGTYEALKMEQD